MVSLPELLTPAFDTCRLTLTLVYYKLRILETEGLGMRLLQEENSFYICESGACGVCRI